MTRRTGGEAETDTRFRILVVDDEELIRRLMDQLLTAAGYHVTTAIDGREGVGLLEHERFDLLISDMVMPYMSGAELLAAAKRLDPELPVVIMTGYPSVASAKELMQEGAVDYITKPFDVDVVAAKVAAILGKARNDEP